jgi:5-formyltetrahydrofolate cyclo-ligase
MPTTKQTLRERVRAVSNARELAWDRLRDDPRWQRAKTVLLFASMADEPDVTVLHERGKRVLYPRVVSRDLELVTCELGPEDGAAGWRRGAYGLWEPVGEATEPMKVDVAVVPGLAFTRDGRRLGRGGGFYDRLLPTLRRDCWTVGVCGEARLLDDLPTEPHDAPVDAVLTEQHLHDVNSPSR